MNIIKQFGPGRANKLALNVFNIHDEVLLVTHVNDTLSSNPQQSQLTGRKKKKKKPRDRLRMEKKKAYTA